MDGLLAAAVPPTDAEFKDWLTAVKDDVGIDDLVDNFSFFFFTRVWTSMCFFQVIVFC